MVSFITFVKDIRNMMHDIYKGKTSKLNLIGMVAKRLRDFS